MRSAQRTLIAVPMKDPYQAKTRLGHVLDPERRAALALLLFEQMIDRLYAAVDRSPLIGSDIAVVTASASIRKLADSYCVPVIQDRATGLSAAAERVRLWSRARKYDALCIFPADLAAPDPADLRRVLEYPIEDTKVLICPSLDLGTNALVLPPSSEFAFQYGPRSFLAHRQAAQKAGLTPVILPCTSLRRDVDTVDDLSFLDDGVAVELRASQLT